MKGTLKSKQEIERLFNTGRRFVSSLVIIIFENINESKTNDQVSNNSVAIGKCAYIAGKKIGTAPQRNRCKRIMRSITYELGAPWEQFNIIFVARSSLLYSDYSYAKKVFQKSLKHIGAV